MNTISRFLGLLTLAVFLASVLFPQPLARAGTDTTPPTGTIVINSNRTATKSLNVALSLTWSDGVDGSGVTRMRFSNDGATWSTWEPLVYTRAYALPAGDGYKTVRVQYLDKAGNRSLIYNDYIRLDTVAPTGGIIINGGAMTTTTRGVTLGLNWADTGSGVTRMRFSDNGSAWTAWESPKGSRAFTLPEGLGYHTVRVQYTDAAENYSVVYNDYIKLVALADTVVLPGNVPLTMIWIPGGTFPMGRYEGERDSNPDEDPRHLVSLSGFWMAKYELTKRQWMAVMGTTPWSGQSYVLADLDSPAVSVSWDNAQSFLTAMNGYTGKTFSLPSEAQWEYACRGGTQYRYYWGDDPDYSAITNCAWYWGNCSAEMYAHVVGGKTPNAFGLYDMSGNVSEWCEDDWHGSYTDAPIDGQAWVDSPRASHRVFRGGGWFNLAPLSRSAYRDHYAPDGTSDHNGFRVVRTP